MKKKSRKLICFLSLASMIILHVSLRAEETKNSIQGYYQLREPTRNIAFNLQINSQQKLYFKLLANEQTKPTIFVEGGQVILEASKARYEDAQTGCRLEFLFSEKEVKVSGLPFNACPSLIGTYQKKGPARFNCHFLFRDPNELTVDFCAK